MYYRYTMYTVTFTMPTVLLPLCPPFISLFALCSATLCVDSLFLPYYLLTMLAFVSLKFYVTVAFVVIYWQVLSYYPIICQNVRIFYPITCVTLSARGPSLYVRI